MLENPMVTEGANAQRKAEAAEHLRDRCFEMHVAEMLDALHGPAHGLVSSGHSRIALWHCIEELFQEDSTVLAFLTAVRENKSVPLMLAEFYAARETAFNVENGCLDV